MKNLIVPVLLSVQITSAASWLKKDPSTWSPQEVKQILSDSAWARPAVASFPPAESEDNTNVVPSGSAPGTIGYDGKWDGTPSRHLGDLPTFQVMVRWESAAPVREARRRSFQLLQVSIPANSYVIGLLGLWPAEQQSTSEPKADPTQPVLGSLRPHSIDSLGGRPDHRTQQDLGHMRQELRSVSKIVRPDRRAIAPEDVQLDPATGEILIIFPKDDTIDLGEREIAFSSRFGSMVIEKKFRLKDMLYHGKLEL